jgi:hypothetical protein
MIQVCKQCKNDIQAVDGKGKRVCPVCGCYEFEPVKVNRKTAKCCYCGVLGKEIKGELPFYNADANTFYCGCRGWD